MAKPVALIIARDPMTGALLGSLVEVSGFEPRFPAPDDDVPAAIRRLRPAVVLVDCDSGDEEECYDPVSEYGGSVILFSPSRSAGEVQAIASRRGLRHFALPIHWTDFRQLLNDAVS